MEYVSSMPVSLLVAILAGALGGALNAAVADDARVMPSLVRLAPEARVLRIGIVGNAATGTIAVAGVFAALEAAGFTLSTISVLGLGPLALCMIFIAFVSARGVTNEADKLVLRKALRKAVSAPAAHPDTLGDMDVAPPDTVYTIVDRLMPRRAGHR